MMECVDRSTALASLWDGRVATLSDL
jgi:hypothetical protein